MAKINRKKTRVSWCKVLPNEITNLSSYLALLDFTLREKSSYWFRGHSSIEWELKPSALRHNDNVKVKSCLEIHHEFRRLSINKILKAPALSEEFAWLGIAQHYGLPTRFLDWTQNPAIALYFAINDNLDSDGCVYLLNPFELNRSAVKQDRILDGERDKALITKYLSLGPEVSKSKSLKTIAINPLYNSERISLQRGAFTLHGNKSFSLDDKQASSLVCIKIKKEYKKSLKGELARIGIDRMSIFPEIEHVGLYLKEKIEG